MKILKFNEYISEKLMGFEEGIADKLSKVLDKETTYTFDDIQAAIPKSGGAPRLHSDDARIVADRLKEMGFKIEGLDEHINDDVKPDLKAKYPDLVKALTAAKVPCKVKLLADELVVECGFDYPDEIGDKVSDAIESIGLKSNDVTICADQGGGTVIESTRIAGGPKRY